MLTSLPRLQSLGLESSGHSIGAAGNSAAYRSQLMASLRKGAGGPSGTRKMHPPQKMRSSLCPQSPFKSI